jgi:hypothetical protein
MGNIGPKKREKLDQEYDMMVEEGVEPILAEQYGDDPFNLMYGFSNRMIVTQWLARIEPFTTRNFLFSDQKREKRLPVDMFKSFELGMNHKQSNSELIPEHFYLPEMFMNSNLLSLGNQPLNDESKHFPGVKFLQQDSFLIPKWALNVHDFVRV